MSILLFSRTKLSKKYEQEILSIINFFLLIFESILEQVFISKNSIFLKFFLNDNDIFFKSQKNLIFLFLSIKI